MKAFVSHFDAGVDGTDEEDVCEDDENADVQPEHECCSVENEETQAIRKFILTSLTPQLVQITFSGQNITGKLGEATYWTGLLLTLGK